MANCYFVRTIWKCGHYTKSEYHDPDCDQYCILNLEKYKMMKTSVECPSCRKKEAVVGS